MSGKNGRERGKIRTLSCLQVIGSFEQIYLDPVSVKRQMVATTRVETSSESIRGVA